MDESVYIIGPLASLQAAFPQHDFTHARKSLDGLQAVIDVPSESAQEHFDTDLMFLTHEEAVEYLNDPDMAGIWYEEVNE